MKQLIYTFLLLLLVHEGTAQKVRVGFEAGYGIYQFSQLKSFQADLADFSPIESVQMVEQFPNFFNYSGNVEFYHKSIDILLIGLNVAYFSTGGRNHVKDYSGEYKLDLPLKGYRVGIQLRTLMSNHEKLKLYSKLKIGGMFSTMKLEETLEVYDEKPEFPSYTFRSDGVFFEPSLGLSYEVIEKLHIDLSLGYQIDMNAYMYNVETPELIFYNSNREKITINWSGIRTYLGVAYDIF